MTADVVLREEHKQGVFENWVMRRIFWHVVWVVRGRQSNNRVTRSGVRRYGARDMWEVKAESGPSSTKQRPAWEAVSSSDVQELLLVLWNSKVYRMFTTNTGLYSASAESAAPPRTPFLKMHFNIILSIRWNPSRSLFVVKSSNEIISNLMSDWLTDWLTN